ncbi:MAG: subtype I-F CRISPR-associated endonuclease Cas1 [Helicobacteraceae bacterium 4484_230]|nr:MAG: subtype I-F CRISPR-associated endonuclease Cas1 [Helicobacteraceae bacterium 4484_230]
MQQLTDLKAILHSKRANIYYLEKCRVMQKDGRVLYLNEAKKEYRYWNIPIANTTCLLLGMGTSITQAAMRMLAQAGVLVGFSGSGATPLFMANEIEWLTPQSKAFQATRIKFLKKVWGKDRNLQYDGFDMSYNELQMMLQNALEHIQNAPNVGKLLQIEADLTKRLYKHAAKATGQSSFVREHNAADLANEFLNHGNYLAYGLAATVLWVLGIPHGFAVMHGKTRRGALVFDVADLVKDALVLPWAFIGSKEGMDEKAFRSQCLQAFVEHGALDFMFNTVKDIAMQYRNVDGNTTL